MRKYSKFFAVLLAIVMILPGIAQAAPEGANDIEAGNVMRLAGEDRIGTAISISKEAFEDDSTDSVVVVGNRGEIDALAGTLLADAKNAPVLIAKSKEVSPEVKSEIERLGAENVYILGGEAAVVPAIEKELKGLGLDVKRLAGKNRFETAAKVAKEVNGETSNKIFLASGEDARLADALSIAPVSAKENVPVLLVKDSKSPSQTTMDAIKELGVKEIEFVGGEEAISDSIKKDFSDIKFDRVAGSNRVNTALEIAGKYFKESDKSIVTYGWKHADALVGGYLSAKEDAPILLTNTNNISVGTTEYIGSKSNFSYVLGGFKVVSSDVFNKIAKVLGVDPSELTLTILGTTDIHGHIYNWSYEDGQEIDDSGMVKVKSVIDEVKKENPNTILLDAGDLIQGTILTDEIYTRDLERINPMIDVFNYIGYDAMVLGNHEFNFGIDVVDKLMVDADFPVLGANIYNKDGTNYADPYTVVEKAGLRIGVLGLTTPNIPRWDGDKVKDLDFIGMDEAADIHMDDLKGENVDLIVTVAHAGLDKEYIEGDDMRTVIEEHPEIDVSIVGHSHASVENTVGTTIVGGARSEGREVIRFDIDLAEKDDEWEVLDKRVELIETKDYKASEDLKEYTKEYHETTLEFISGEIGTATGDFVPEAEVKGIPEAQIRDTAVMDLINMIQLKDSEADVSAAALFSSTSNIEEGTITYADIFDIYKFPNTLVKVEVSGQELMDYMEWSVKYYNTFEEGDVTISFNPEVRAYLYDMFAGVDYKIDISKPAGERITDLEFEGEAVKADDTLTLVVNDYRYSGLKNEEIISGDPIYESAPVSSRELIYDYIKESGTIDPVVDNNWEIIGADLDHPLRDYIIDEVNKGNIELPTSEDGRTPNAKSLNVYELIEEGKIPEDVLEDHGLDSEGNPK